MALADPYARPMSRPLMQTVPSQAKIPAPADAALPLSGKQFDSRQSGLNPDPNRARLPARSNNTAMQYQRAQVETASPTRLIILLYEGAMRFCRLALDAMAQQDLPARHDNLLKAQRIVTELFSSLNREQGGEVADNLSRLYTHMLEELVKANLYDQPEPIETVEGMLRDLRDSWIEVERLTGMSEAARIKTAG